MFKFVDSNMFSVIMIFVILISQEVSGQIPFLGNGCNGFGAGERKFIINPNLGAQLRRFLCVTKPQATTAMEDAKLIATHEAIVKAFTAAVPDVSDDKKQAWLDFFLFPDQPARVLCLPPGHESYCEPDGLENALMCLGDGAYAYLTLGTFVENLEFSEICEGYSKITSDPDTLEHFVPRILRRLAREP